MNKKRIVLYLTFVPYILLFLYCFINLIIDGDFFGCFYNIYEDIVIGYGFIFLLLIIGYQLWYFIFEYNPKKVKKSKWNIFIRKAVPILKKILFGLSLLIWFLYILSGIYSYFSGFESCFITCNTVYGFDALLESMFYIALLFGIMIPVLPITLIYMIMYVVKLRKSTKK